MTEPQTAESIASLTAAVERLEATVAKIAGFAADDDEWEWVECDGDGVWAPLRPRDGAEPLRAEILVSLSIGQVQQIPFETDTQYRDVYPCLVRTIRDWNVTALNLMTGEYEKIIPPSLGGESSLEAVRLGVKNGPMILNWLIFSVKFLHLRNRFPKSLQSAEDGAESPSASDSASQEPDPSPSNRTTST